MSRIRILPLMSSRMKFWQRLIILCGSAFFTLFVYLMVSEESTWEDAHIQKARLVQSRLWPKKPNESFVLHKNLEMCNLQSWEQSQSRISTFDVYQKSEFNMNSDGSYEMASPPPDYPNNSENELDHLDVIIVPHSHNDPGWLKTVEEYYVDQTKHILTNMVNKLFEHPNMTFIWTETVFFSMWWNELDDDVKVHVRRLIRRGQLEIVLGGWVMPDEATTHYVSVIDQLLEGHQWLWENLGVKPKNSWSIDPFGYSGTMPYIWKKAGMENMVIQRVHQAIKSTLAETKSLEFWWRQMWDAKGSSDILCHVMPYMLYNIKFTCGPNRFHCLLFDFRHITNEVSESRAKSINANNVEKLATYLYEQYRKKSYLYKYNTVLVPLGDDFRYDMEIEWDQQYNNYQRLMDYMNNRKDWKINVRFGTLKDYFKVANKKNKKNIIKHPNNGFPVLSGDFFPYSDQENAYWTGYYTTRPFDKKFSRDLQANLQAADILNTLAYTHLKKWDMNYKDQFFQFSTLLLKARRALGLFLHHDAITGTAKEFVVVDYEQKLAEAYNNTQLVMKTAIQILASSGKLMSPLVFRPETIRPAHDEEPLKKIFKLADSNVRVMLFNPLPQYRQEVVRFLVDSSTIIVKNEKFQIVPCQVNPIWLNRTTVSPYVFEVAFVVTLPPFGIVPFILFKADHLDVNNVFPSRISIYNTDELSIPKNVKFYIQRPESKPIQPIVLENEHMRIGFDATKGTMTSVLDKETGNKTDVAMDYFAYKSQGSGAYIFYPSPTENTKVIYDIPVIRKISGPIYSKLEVVFNHYLKYSVTLYHVPTLQSQGIHIENHVDIRPLKDREFVMRFKTSINNRDGSYFTDQNGFQLIRRKTNSNLRIEANYYPMTSMAMLEDNTQRLSLLSAQSHGVASLENGWLEVMLDRQLTYDDHRGLGEHVEDNKPVTSNFVLLLENRRGPNKHQNSHYALPSLLSVATNDFLQQPVVKYYSTIDSDIFHKTVSPVSLPLPCDISVVTFRSLATANFIHNGTSLILHRRGYDCDFPDVGLQCSVDNQQISLQTLLNKFPISSIRETTLTHLYEKRIIHAKTTIEIPPMEIAAYHINW
ncbi:alpha-mannosidase 2x [Patella vulgata]|uniref:alpha-mannosidase 2x n=1 Tax=Patella vulgata TaxID=6465 RepID=UPI0024A9D5D9|nr:alpha-mannosidase 2x [Patella vulgata]XP_050406528.2 alpha-mannosidase 2x [Patella vulgata]XP_050406530.2 alpha-mannosidase 2x [Patella vulgata]XP_050406531.2 alpha-mannosidase 2x [Patella vulgata]XP_055957146.1 alpha-mannosidase 2x [Patella vulgata]